MLSRHTRIHRSQSARPKSELSLGLFHPFVTPPVVNRLSLEGRRDWAAIGPADVKCPLGRPRSRVVWRILYLAHNGRICLRVRPSARQTAAGPVLPRLTGGNSVDLHSKEHIGAAPQRSKASRSHTRLRPRIARFSASIIAASLLSLGFGASTGWLGTRPRRRRRSDNAQPGRRGQRLRPAHGRHRQQPS